MAIETLYVNANGDTIQWVAAGAAFNWDCVDEDPDNGDTDYVSSVFGASPSQDLYNLPAPTTIAPGDTINSITVYYWGRKIGTYTVTIAACVKENGVLTVGTGLAMTTSYVEKSQAWTTRPSDGAKWTYADVLALQIGVKDNGRQSTGGTARVTQVRVVVDYTRTWVLVSHHRFQ